MKDFFISYNRADRTWAEWIAWQLEEAGYSVVLQAWDFRPASNFVLEMDRAAVEAERTIAVLSPAYLDALYTQPEWAAAFAQDPTAEKGTLLPVRVRECELKGLLAQIVYIDLVGLDEPKAKEALLEGIKRERAKPTVKPGFPAGVERSIPEQPRFPRISAADLERPAQSQSEFHRPERIARGSPQGIGLEAADRADTGNQRAWRSRQNATGS